jgi:uncharacterized membrane protein YkvI
MILAVFVAGKVGLVGLVDKGYKLLAWVYIFIFMIPILTYGIWRIVRPQQAHVALAASSGAP